MKGILARKIGMTQIISQETREATPVTLIKIPENKILQVKTNNKDGYAACLLGAFERKNYGKNENKKYLFKKELLLSKEDYKKGDTLNIEDLKEVKKDLTRFFFQN